MDNFLTFADLAEHENKVYELIPKLNSIFYHYKDAITDILFTIT